MKDAFVIKMTKVFEIPRLLDKNPPIQVVIGNYDANNQKILRFVMIRKCN